MGPSPMDVDIEAFGVLPTRETIETNGMTAIGKGGCVSPGMVIGGDDDGRPQNASFSMTLRHRGPLTKQLLLSRRLLHRSGVGYLDESVPLLLSTIIDG